MTILQICLILVKQPILALYQMFWLTDAHMYDDVRLYTSPRKENINSCLDSLNRDLEKLTAGLQLADYASILPRPSVLYLSYLN